MTDRILPAAPVGQRTCRVGTGKAKATGVVGPRGLGLAREWLTARQGKATEGVSPVSRERENILRADHMTETTTNKQTQTDRARGIGILMGVSGITQIGTPFALQVMVYQPVFYHYLACGCQEDGWPANRNISRPDPPV